MPTNWNPHRVCSAMEASPVALMRANTAWKPESSAVFSSSCSSNRPMPRPWQSLRT